MLFNTILADVSALFWEREFWGNSPARWAVAAGVLLGVLVVLTALKAFLARRAALIAERTGQTGWTVVEIVAAATSKWVILLTSIYSGALLIVLPPKIQASLRVATVIALLIQAALWGNVAVQFFTTRWVQRRLQKDPASAPFSMLAGYAGRVAIWTFVLLLILENLGIEVTALLTGLGIGGIAIALAVQNILGDLFASLSIVVDKPFVIGDFIVVGDDKGTVENIGLKTTRVRSLSGEQLVFPNSDLLQSRIHNFKRMDERRILFKIGVLYETPPDQLAALPQMIREIIEAQSPVRFDRAHFQGFGDSSLDYEIVYFVLSPDYNVYMDIQQAINLELVRRCNALKIGFAYPTRTVYMQQVGGDANNDDKTNTK